MRLLGIDYGTKKIGLALSDSTGVWPAQLQVLVNDKGVLEKIINLCVEKAVSQIIIGQSLNYRGRPNPLADLAEKFGRQLSAESGLPVAYENETLTSKEAERIVGRDKHSDARAAALILKSYIDRQR